MSGAADQGKLDGDRRLAAVGLDELEERIYRYVLDWPASTLADVAAEIGASTPRARNVLTALENMGLVSPTPTRPLRYTAVAPQVALEALVQHHLGRLSAVRVAAEQLQERFHATVGARAFEAVELLTGPQAISQHFIQLQRAARREVAVLDRPPYFLPAPLNEQVEADVLRRGVPARAIYDERALEDRGRLQGILTSQEAGERSRLIKELPLKLALIDDSALVPLLAHPDDQRMLIIHRSALVDGLYLLFELLWERSTPLGLTGPDRAEHGLSETAAGRDRAILAMLAGGLPDKVIAHQLGLSARTVARRISRLMRQLGAQGRFQAGARAAALGWLDDTDEAKD